MKRGSKTGFRTCKCGCGQPVSDKARFVSGHNFAGKKHSRKTKEIIRKHRIAKLQKDMEDLAPHRLHFPARKRDESLGDYKFRRFEYFCQHYVTHIAGAKYAHTPVVLMPWQKTIIKKLLGTLDEDGRRQYKNLFLHVARKNGKTFMTCLLILFYLSELSFDDPACEIVSVAATREQSISTIFKTCRLMVSYSKELSQLLKVTIVPARITNLLNNGVYEPLSSDAPHSLGRNVSMSIFDESHAQPNEELWSALSTSSSMRDQNLMISISTAADTRACWYFSLYAEMKKIEADPSRDIHTLVSIFECPEDRDWQDPASYLLANPAAGEGGFRPVEELEQSLKRAISGVGESAYKQFYLNQFAKYGSKNLVPLDKWDLCGSDDIDLDALKNRRLVAGLDWSETTDLTAIAVIFEGPPEARDRWTVLVFSWLAGETLSECSRRDRLPYEKWANSKEQWVYFEGKPTIDVTDVSGVLGGLQEQFKLRFIGYDPYLSSAMAPLMEYFEMTPVPQSYAFLSPATKLLKVKILKGELIHDHNPLLRSMIENSKVISDPSGNIKLDKSKSTSRIDGLVSITIGFAIAIDKWKEVQK